jgi:hypothetical protein
LRALLRARLLARPAALAHGRLIQGHGLLDEGSRCRQVLVSNHGQNIQVHHHIGRLQNIEALLLENLRHAIGTNNRLSIAVMKFMGTIECDGMELGVADAIFLELLKNLGTSIVCFNSLEQQFGLRLVVDSPALLHQRTFAVVALQCDGLPFIAIFLQWGLAAENAANFFFPAEINAFKFARRRGCARLYERHEINVFKFARRLGCARL